MSFTGEVKNEVSKLVFDEADNISELSAIIQNFCDDGIKIITENGSVARRIYSLFRDIFNIHPFVSVRRGYNYSKKMLYVLEIRDNVSFILKSLGIDGEIPADFIWADDDLIKAYLRGLFLISASVNDPKKSRYHLEFNLKSLKYADFVSFLLNKFKLNSKIIHRDNRYMVYIKEAEKIGDFLRIIGASRAVLYFEDIRIYRDHKNMTNRLNNCEQANVDRAIETANKQVKDIKFIREICGLELLGEKEMEAALYREKYPDASILELSQIISMETGKSITKSGLYHRLNKIRHFADRLRDN